MLCWWSNNKYICSLLQIEVSNILWVADNVWDIRSTVKCASSPCCDELNKKLVQIKHNYISLLIGVYKFPMRFGQY